jgi:hypothetical protein
VIRARIRNPCQKLRYSGRDGASAWLEDVADTNLFNEPRIDIIRLLQHVLQHWLKHGLSACVGLWAFLASGYGGSCVGHNNNIISALDRNAASVQCLLPVELGVYLLQSLHITFSFFIFQLINKNYPLSRN